MPRPGVMVRRDPDTGKWLGECDLCPEVAVLEDDAAAQGWLDEHAGEHEEQR